jgi:NhaA family Na+:H+ antiporter
MQRALSDNFLAFFNSEKSSGVLLIACTTASLLITNSSLGNGYGQLWQITLGGLSLEHWVNDGLMAVFFLLIGLELERELYIGELSDLRNAQLPIFVAVGGMIAPALLHFLLNKGTSTQAGFGIPMATDIAFALGVLALLGSRIPPSLKVLLTAFAVIDDLGAIITIAVFYTTHLAIWPLIRALAIWAVLIGLNRLRVLSLVPYLLGGAALWVLLLKSGVHATLAGVVLAFAVPFASKGDTRPSPSHSLEHFLHKPVAFFILPLFALANTGIPLVPGWLHTLTSANSVGILAGLVLGKPFGVMLLCGIAVATGICRLPPDLQWRHILGAGMLGGIGFTMSIFITNLAFMADAATVNAAKTAILLASLMAGSTGFFWLLLCNWTNIPQDNRGAHDAASAKQAPHTATPPLFGGK